MSRFVMIAASLTLFSALPVNAAPKAAPFPMAADGTTNIADCAKADVKFRNECISKSRPVTGKQLYADDLAQKALAAKKQALDAAKAAKAAKAAAAAKVAAEKAAAAKAAKAASVPAKVVGAPKGFKISKDGTTNVADCAKAAASVRDACISRARPMTGKELAKFIKARSAAVPAVKAAKAEPKAAAKAAAVKALPVAVAPVAAKPSLPVLGKGFKVAKDGTTNIADCANAKPEFRNECISKSRPVSGKEIYANSKAKQ